MKGLYERYAQFGQSIFVDWVDRDSSKSYRGSEILTERAFHFGKDHLVWNRSSTLVVVDHLRFLIDTLQEIIIQYNYKL